MSRFFFCSAKDSPCTQSNIPFLALEKTIFVACLTFSSLFLLVYYLQKTFDLSKLPLFYLLLLIQSPYSIGGCMTALLCLRKTAQKYTWQKLLNLPKALPFSQKRFLLLLGSFLSLLFFGSLIINLLVSKIVYCFTNRALPEHFLFTFLQSSSKEELFSVFIAVVIIAPVCEEIIFRRLLHNYFRQICPNLASLLTAVIFAVAHALLWSIPTYLFIGIILQMAERKASLWMAIALHALFNLLMLGTVLIN